MKNFLYITMDELNKIYEYYLEFFSKEDLAKMLAIRDISIKHQQPQIITTIDGSRHICKSLADCTNPHFDCVNCPLRGYYRGYTTLTNN